MMAPGWRARIALARQPLRIDAEFSGHLGRHAGGPGEDGVALLLGEAMHQHQGARLVDQLAAALVEPEPPLLRLEHLVGGARVVEGVLGGARQRIGGRRRSDGRWRRRPRCGRLRRRQCRGLAHRIAARGQPRTDLRDILVE